MFAVNKQSLAKLLFTFLAAILVLFTSAAPVLADDYNCGAYGAGTYQNNVCGASTSGGDGLANTGQSIWLILLGVLLILGGTYILYRTRKKMKARTAYKVGV